MIWYWVAGVAGVAVITIVVALVAGAVIHWGDQEDEL